MANDDASGRAKTADDLAKTAEAKAAPPPSGSVLDLEGIDVEFIDDDIQPIDKLLKMTDETWSIDGQVESLKEAAKDPRAPESSEGGERDSIQLPTPFELGVGDRSEAPPAVALKARPAAKSLSDAEPAARAAAAPRVPHAPSPPSPPAKASLKPPPPLPAGSPSQRPVAPVVVAAKASGRPPPLPSDALPTEPIAEPPQPPGGGVKIVAAREAKRAPTQPRLPEEGAALVELLEARIQRLSRSDERVTLARGHIELSIVSEMMREDARATAHAEAALEIDEALPEAHTILRRRIHSRGALPAMLAHLAAELVGSSSEAQTAELLVERARLTDALGDDPDATLRAWREAYGRAPNHAAALKGIEGELALRAYLQGGDEAWEQLAAHYAHMADAFAGEAELAAWLHVERATVAEWKLGDLDVARGSLERALALDPSIGPVRDALVRHVSAHGDSAALASLLASEAKLETDEARAARLELDAALLTERKVGDEARAIQLLERCASRAGSSPLVERRALDELVRLHERSSQWHEAARARRARLRFFESGQSVVHELRQIASLEERTLDADGAIADLTHARTLAPDDPDLVEALDRLIGSLARDDDRIALWMSEAARVDDGAKRAKALGRAAALAEQLGRPDEALRHLRAAWVAAPGDPDLVDHLSRLMSPGRGGRADASARALVDLYTQAAHGARDPGRRVAFLEKVALLWEELLGESERAARVYEEILEIEPERRGAVLGLERTAGRAGDDRALARALLDEARLPTDGVDSLALRVRAAATLARVDAARAIAIVDEVLAADAAHAGARQLETRLHEEAGRWERAAASIKARIPLAATPGDRVALWLHLARVESSRLRRPHDAVSSLLAAREIDPSHPVPAEDIARILEAAGDFRALRDALTELAKTASSPEERARHLVRIAEIEEIELEDDEAATATYVRARNEVPGEDLVSERLERVLSRRGRLQTGIETAAPQVAAALDELATHLARRADATSSSPQRSRLLFAQAHALVQLGKEPQRATAILEAILADDPHHVPALRTLEGLARLQTNPQALATVLSLEGAAFTDLRARLGSLWGLVALEEWRIPTDDRGRTYRRILELDPTDPGALEALLRLSLSRDQRDDAVARKTAIDALRSLSALATDDGALVATQLRLAMLLDVHAADQTESALAARYAAEAMERYRAVLLVDPASVTAATCLARLATRLGDTGAAVTAAVALADLAAQKKARARYLLDAAELLIGPSIDESLGTPAERAHRATELLEKCLAADADALHAAQRLAQIRQQQGLSERAVDVFRSALDRATRPEAIVFLGTEIARVARDELGSPSLAIDAMREVRQAVPDHVPSLLTLAELCIAQRAWPEAIDALEDVVARADQVGPRLTALFALASIYEKVLSRPDDAEIALRTALSLDDRHPKAIRSLIHRLAAKQNDQPDPREALPIKLEIAGLLERLAEVEADRKAKSDILLELADLRVQLKDSGAAEKALVEAVAQAPAHARAFAKLGRFFRGPEGVDAVSYARALSAVIGRGQKLGHADARWLATLGHIEVVSLGRLRDGVGHLSQAVQMNPELYESRFELATAYVRLGAHEDAIRSLLALAIPEAKPLLSLADPASALELLERAFNGERRPEEAIVVSELRAICGDLDDGRHQWLRSRRLPPIESHHAPLDRAALLAHVMPPEGRHVLLEVAAAISGVESRILRADVTELGLSSKDRIGKRSGHPTRVLLDRVAKALGVGDVELVITPGVSRARVLAQDTPWLVLPQSILELPEPTQLASIARAMSRVALAVPWLEELPPPHIEALLVAAARQVVPGYGAEDVDALAGKLVAQYEASLSKELGRKQKQALERLAPQLRLPTSRPITIDVLISALAKAELRIAYVVIGDLLATIDELRGLDQAFLAATEVPGRGAVGAVLDHPFAGDVVRFALTTESTALRRRVAATWAG